MEGNGSNFRFCVPCKGVHFSDTCCDSVAELRAIILKARSLANDHAEQERAAAAIKTWLLAQIEKNHARRRQISRIRHRTHRSSPNASRPGDRSRSLRVLLRGDRGFESRLLQRIDSPRIIGSAGDFMVTVLRPEIRALVTAVLEVQIHLPPADSPCLAQTRPLQVEKPAVPRGCASLRSAETTQYWSKLRKPALLSLSGDIPVPQCR